MACGCSGPPPSPPSQATVTQRIQSSTTMTPAMQQQALTNMRMHSMAGRARYAAMHHGRPGQ